MSAVPIRRLRLDLRLSQSELAVLLGVQPTAISRWERGGAISKLALRALALLAVACGRRPADYDLELSPLPPQEK